MTSTCPGDCCEDFTFPKYPKDQLLNILIATWPAYYRYDGPGERELIYGPNDTDESVRARTLDALKIRDMLIAKGKGEDGYERFTCRFFDTDTRLCTNYENRPKMCRNYPDGNPCHWCTIGETEGAGERR